MSGSICCGLAARSSPPNSAPPVPLWRCGPQCAAPMMRCSGGQCTVWAKRLLYHTGRRWPPRQLGVGRQLKTRRFLCICVSVHCVIVYLGIWVFAYCICVIVHSGIWYLVFVHLYFLGTCGEKLLERVSFCKCHVFFHHSSIRCVVGH